jgi:SNF2 family DNA or RNA helicase
MTVEIVEDTAVKLFCSHELAQLITSYISKSMVTGARGSHSEVLVHWGMDEMQRLARVTPAHIKIPSPIARDYGWPGMFTPFEHQRDTSRFLTLHKRAFCFNEAGTGKTSAAIWAADYLMTQGLIKRVLVVCPLSIMQAAWQSDLFKSAMHRTCGIAHGSTSKRVKVVGGSYDFVIINFDGVGTVEREISAANFDLIIVDEANAYKNPTTKRWKTLSKLIKPDTYLWMMTGTPAAQSPMDAYGLAKMVNPEGVPRRMSSWQEKVMRQITRFKWSPKPESRTIVFDALQPAIRYEKADCLDLPDVTYQTREVPLSPQVYKYYNELKKEMLIKAVGEQITTVNAAAALNKLLQISGGAVYTDNHNVIEFDVSPRLRVLEEVIEESSNKLLIFVPYTHTITLVKNFLDSIHCSSEIINGAVSANERGAIFSRFQNTTDPKILIIQPQAASHGVTLTAADTVIFWSPVMSVETYLQCIARIDRVGQVNKMTVIHLEGSEVERRMYTMLQGKVDMHERLVDLYRSEMESSNE